MDNLMDKIEESLMLTMEPFLYNGQAEEGEPPLWFVDCPPANGNQGEKLLQPRNEGLTLEHLDAVAALGAHGVTLQIQYPVLDWRFPRRDEYGAFYGMVAQNARARGLAVAVETSPVFSGTYSDIEWSYEGMGVYEYKARRAIMAAEIADRVRPDYLSVVHEPGTERALTGLPLTEPEDFLDLMEMVHDLVGWLRPAVRVGGGVPILEARPAVVAAYATVCDFLNVHIYPVSAPGMPNAFVRLLELAERFPQLRFVALETWPFKALDAEYLGMAQDPVAQSVAFYARDRYARWEEFVDPTFLRCLDALGRRASNLEAVSIFWPQYLWGYYHGKSQDPARVQAQLKRTVRRNMRDYKLTTTGETLVELLIGRSR